MPELPDLTVYAERINAHAAGQALTELRITDPFVLRTTWPAPDAFAGRPLDVAELLGKRLLLRFSGDHCLLIHLMLLGRLHWLPGDRKPRGRGLAALDFPAGSLWLTESGRTRRASLHLLDAPATLASFDPGGIDPLTAGLDAFRAAVCAENHTLKRALTDQRIVAGIGNAYSDEILHRARLSPFAHTQKLEADELSRLHAATREVLVEWTVRLTVEAGDWPQKVTAFRPGMAVHGRFGQPCPVCDKLVQRVVFRDREFNYCAACQTAGRILADRALSRLLKASFPRHLDES